MTLTEYLLSKLAEECAEVTQRATKAQTFGLHEVQPGQCLSNIQRLGIEVRDLMVVLEELQKTTGIFPELYDTQAAQEKREKLYKYMDYSRAQGCLY